MKETIILGAGITGLSIAYRTGYQVYEATDMPGGLVRSLFVKKTTYKISKNKPKDEDAFEIHPTGGHWIGNVDSRVIDFLSCFVSVKIYQRISSVLLTNKPQAIIPFPIQNHLHYLPSASRVQILKEISKRQKKTCWTLSEWLLNRFGKTLYNLFFYPFNYAYSAGLCDYIIPQDMDKSPTNRRLILQGSIGATSSVGYNQTFVYPVGGLSFLMKRIALNCRIHYRKRVTFVDLKSKKIYFDDKSSYAYKKIISTIPLNKLIQLTEISVKSKEDPSTSVLVLNIIATRGPSYPRAHWLFISHSKAGFYRVGFYNNVDINFLPKSLRTSNEIISLYVEKAYRAEAQPSEKEIKSYCSLVANELKDWGFIKKVEFCHLHWVETAYTWRWSNSNWQTNAIYLLKKNDIIQAGRYGRWEKANSIADCIRESFLIS